MATYKIPQEVQRATVMHFENGVPLKDLAIRPSQRDRIARVKHVYMQWLKNPMLDTYVMFRELAREIRKSPKWLCETASKDQAVLQFVIDNMHVSSRKVAEARVEYAANHLMQMGMETDNGADIVAGAKLLMKVKQLDKPEEARQDISNAAFIDAVVITDITQIDATKENIDDEETKRIIAKYGGFVDDKRKMIEDRVELMEAQTVDSVDMTTDGEQNSEDEEEQWED